MNDSEHDHVTIVDVLSRRARIAPLRKITPGQRLYYNYRFDQASFERDPATSPWRRATFAACGNGGQTTPVASLRLHRHRGDRRRPTEFMGCVKKLLRLFRILLVLVIGPAMPLAAQDGITDITLAYQFQHLSSGQGLNIPLGFDIDVTFPVTDSLGVVGHFDWSRKTESDTVKGADDSDDHRDLWRRHTLEQRHEVGRHPVSAGTRRTRARFGYGEYKLSRPY